MSKTGATTQMIGPCPCSPEGCGVIGTKLDRDGHLIGCQCPPHRNGTNRKVGKRANRRAHKRLAADRAPIDDDKFYPYPLEVSMESKTGAQIPAALLEGLRGEWADDAWFQAVKKTPVGVQAYPAIAVEVSEIESYLLVRLT